MTIAACYLSSEGVVLGADSTSTYLVPIKKNGTIHWQTQHYDHAQKLFEIGEDSTAGIVIWGLGSVGVLSHRSIIAETDQSARKKKISSLKDLVDIFVDIFWGHYTTQFSSIIPNLKIAPKNEEEEKSKRTMISNFSGGFCIGGKWGDETVTSAWEIEYNPMLSAKPVPKQMKIGEIGFWGWRSLIERLIWGIDETIFKSILQSKQWVGTEKELLDLIGRGRLYLPSTELPIREAIDWIYASLYATIKTMKFAPLDIICGGPIEVAVITADRNFRWVCHKSLSEAIGKQPLKGSH